MIRDMRWIAILLVACTSTVWSPPAPDAHRLRRDAAFARMPDGILLLHSYSALKRWEEPGFRQDPSFYYFTGLGNARGVILALDGSAREASLFVMPTQPWGLSGALSGMQTVFVEALDSTKQQ